MTTTVHRHRPPLASPRAALSRRATATLLLGGAVAIVVWDLLNPTQTITLEVPLVAHLTGLLGGYGAAVMLILMSRAPALERGVGSDQLVRWHALTGRFVIIFIVVHAFTAVLTWAQVSEQSVGDATRDVYGFPGLITATVGTVLLVMVGFASIRMARRRLSYERWHTLHLCTYLAVGLGFAHQLAGSDFAGFRPVQIAWSLLYALAYVLVLRYRVLAPLQQVLRHRLRVVSVTNEADGVASIVLHGRHLAELRTQPGQFMRWRFLTRHTWFSVHPFSLSAPAVRDHLRITVKALGDGSSRLHGLRPGVRVLAEGPYGAMTARRRSRRNVLLIAGGIGITPMRALFETMDVPGSRLTLLYRAASWSDVVFGAELDQIALRRGARLVYLIGPSSEPKNAVTGPALVSLIPDVATHDVYLCAGPRFAEAVRAGLRDAGHKRSQLHEEVFTF